MVVQVDLQADPPLLRLPVEAGGDAPRMEIEFEVVSVYRPRLVRVTAGDGGAAAQEYRIPDDTLDGEDEPAAAGREPAVDPDDDSLVTIVLWAYYEACRQGARGPEDLPWRRPRHSEAWRAFDRAMRTATDRESWWGDPEKCLERARAVYRRL